MSVDNYDWLQAIADHPDLTEDHLCAAYALLGVKTDLDDERRFWLAYELETYGFLRAEPIKPRSWLARRFSRKLGVGYTFLLPDEIVTDAQLDAELSA